ncbi:MULTISPECIES: hypothetical protein [unclassified Streptomyces]|uniref:hypothetical protein n=1 Tax=unclassified Streptomyces TaxID=2593676 RepID=UPI0016616C9C|nr:MULTISPECIES: hypothetical protein [unclassified Streptomyces]MBD0707252.1 hypothetical protein [Streptomyces sp. CBMA291]MBD0713740.1 hypothetical protein [Streptomyces sp. CBMA370]
MTKDYKDDASSAYGPTSLALGAVTVAGVAAMAYVGSGIPFLTAVLALTSGTLGLFRGPHRLLSLAGFVCGLAGVVVMLGFSV